MGRFIKILVWFIALFSLLTISAAVDTIAANQTIRDSSGDTIVSSGESFELGFFSPGRSTNRYLGIWYKNISNGTVVWVANRETPIADRSGVARISSDGSLVVLAGGNDVIWSSNSSVSGGSISNVLVAQLLDTGNLVVRNESSSDPKDFIWQSFDHPGDTFLPGMKIGKNLVTGKDTNLTSWKSADDPSAGEYVIGIDTNGFPQVFERRGSDPYSRFGPWNGLTFNGIPQLGANSLFSQQFVINENEVYYEYDLLNSSISRMYLNPEGSFARLNWIDRTLGWGLYSTANVDNCARYGICGPFGSCNINNAPACSCMEGFVPKRPEEWNVADWSSGCQRRTDLDCGNGDGFMRISGVKFPDTRWSRYNRSMTLGECEIACKSNCSCTAYANLDIRQGGSGCLLWFDELMDVREYDENQVIYIRMAGSELTGVPVPESGSNSKKRIVIPILATSLSLVFLGLTLAVFAWWKRKRSRMERQANSVRELDDYNNENQREDTELTHFSLSTIATATNDFSFSNKIGEGGFGAVFKGTLEGRREIAVKRLSKNSRQGLDEFRNEVRFIAKLQHRNLVKLLGYCVQGDERMLIYEYMPNKSLDLVIFDELRSSMLDWPRRFHIINGIARGLLYLHQDSRLQIIHRDLKASNILLDHDMNPKISDFGLARRFSGYETEANTNNVVGTYGYISPEYAVHGLFSVKSDVFSFGVLVLEIVSGKKNRGFSQEEHNDSLLGHAWRLHNEGRSLELVNESLRRTCINSEALRSIHIGLLCVQHHAEDRPSMSSVVMMLGNDGTLPPPKQPAFFSTQRMAEHSSSSTAPTTVSTDDVTITLLEAR